MFPYFTDPPRICQQTLGPEGTLYKRRNHTNQISGRRNVLFCAVLRQADFWPKKKFFFFGNFMATLVFMLER